MKLTQFKRLEDNTYYLKFDDGYEVKLTAQQLRDNCPCAGCKGEEVLLHKFEPIHKAHVSEKGYILESASPVGNYAIQFFWKDGHNTGIYTWEYLRELMNL